MSTTPFRIEVNLAIGERIEVELTAGEIEELEAATVAEATAQRRSEIMARLAELDALAIRPLRAVAAGTSTTDDRDKLTALEVEAVALRTELAGLED